MTEKNKRVTTNIRLDKDVWVFIHNKAFEKKMSFNALLTEIIKKYKKKCENT